MKIAKILFLTLFFVTLKSGSVFRPVTINFINKTNHEVVFEVITNMGEACHFQTPIIRPMGTAFINLDSIPYKPSMNLRFCPSRPETSGQTWVTQILARYTNGACIKTLIFQGENSSTCRTTHANQFAQTYNLTITLSSPQMGRSSLVTSVAPTALSNSGVGGGTLSVDEAYNLSAASN